MMPGNHFRHENALLASQRMCEKCRFSEKKMHFGQFLAAGLRTPRSVPDCNTCACAQCWWRSEWEDVLPEWGFVGRFL